MNDAFGKYSQMSASLAMAATSAGNGNRAEMAHNVIGVTAAALMVLSINIGHSSDENESREDFDPTQRITNDTFLFAALLVANAIEVGRHHKVAHIDNAFGLDCIGQFNPESFLKAADMFETLTNRKPDSFLCPPMVEWFRGAQAKADKAVNLSEFFAKGRSN